MSPFPLSEFPKELGGWRAKEGKEETLEPDIAQIAGASDHLIRTYVDDKTGEGAVVMIIYGLAAKGVWAHIPAGLLSRQRLSSRLMRQARWMSSSGTRDHGAQSFAKYMQGFDKSKPPERDFREVYHSFRYAGEWGLDMGKNWKMFRYNPGMFKVQVQRQNPRSSIESENESVDEFLGLIVREIDQHVAQKH